MEEQNEQTWENLPPHVLIGIYKNLNISDIITLSLTNKWFQQYATHNEVWEQRCLKLRSDLLFLTIAGNTNHELPEWLLNYEEAKTVSLFLRSPPPNFFFLEFMMIWVRYPHAWKRGNNIVDCKAISMKEIKDYQKDYTAPFYFEPKRVYENWKEYYSFKLIPTLWLHNNQNGSYQVKRFTIKEPFYFELPFSKLLYGVDPKDNSIKSIPKPDKRNRPPFVRKRFKLRNVKMENFLEISKIATVATTATFFVATVGLLILDSFTSYNLPYYVMNYKDTCEIIKPTIEQLLNPDFQGKLIHLFDTSIISGGFSNVIGASGATAIAHAMGPAISQLQTMFGVSSIFAYDNVQFENIPPLEELCVFITSEGDVTKYTSAWWDPDNGRAITFPVNWIHDMDNGKYDPLGKEMCSNCNQQKGSLVMEGLECVGSFCNEKCAENFWEKK